jgi:hypothetical protein
MSNQTPTPWALAQQTQAAHVVKCVNAHDQLVAFVEMVAAGNTEFESLESAARELLAKVQS